MQRGIDSLSLLCVSERYCCCRLNNKAKALIWMLYDLFVVSPHPGVTSVFPLLLGGEVGSASMRSFSIDNIFVDFIAFSDIFPFFRPCERGIVLGKLFSNFAL